MGRMKASIIFATFPVAAGLCWQDAMAMTAIEGSSMNFGSYSKLASRKVRR